MNALVERPSDRPAETVRWATCFAVVAAAHGLGAMVLLNNSFEDSDFGIDAPVVMLELPESLVTSTAPAPNLPPGPIQEQENEKTPPPKEETKPPEPEADVALAMPEPPKPEPPAEEKQATAPPQARPLPSSITRWRTLLAAHIRAFQAVPGRGALARRTRYRQGGVQDGSRGPPSEQPHRAKLGIDGARSRNAGDADARAADAAAARSNFRCRIELCCSSALQFQVTRDAAPHGLVQIEQR